MLVKSIKLHQDCLTTGTDMATNSLYPHQLVKSNSLSATTIKMFFSFLICIIVCPLLLFLGVAIQIGICIACQLATNDNGKPVCSPVNAWL